MTDDPIGACAARVAAALAARGETVAIAESTTGGRVCAALLALPGASAWFRGGVVVYTPASRRVLLGIEAAQVRHLAPLSEPMARHFAEAARERLQATWGLAELGVAGPTGVRYGPAGTCVIAVAGPRSASLRLETGVVEREANMRHFTDAALRLLAATVGHAAGPEQGRMKPDAAGWRAWLRDEAPSSRRQAAWGRAWRAWESFSANRLAMLGLGIVLALVAVAALAGVLAPYPPDVGRLSDRLLPPSTAHWLGTDDQGRDILSRLMHGARITLVIVGLVAVLAAPVGLLVGTLAGYAGGVLDVVLMRITDIFLAFPKLVLALAFAAALGPGIENAVIAIAVTSWPPYARLARAETLGLRQADYIQAVRLLGAGPMRIVLRHVMPMCLPSVIVRVSLDMAGVILTAAGLGFLGLGAQPPAPEWGAMIAAGRQVVLDHGWVAAAPGAAIFLVSLGFNLLGDGLRDALDPKSGER